MRYKTIAIAGTFDRLHKGHRFFISEAFKMGERVVVGVTSDKYVDKSKFKMQNAKFNNAVRHLGGSPKDSPEVEEFRVREGELRAFLEQKGWLDRAKIIAIDDVYGPAVEDNEIEALAVTHESLNGGKLVNRKRRERGLGLLRLLRLPIVMAQDRRKISSTRIRFGEIDRWGKVYGRLPLWGKAISDQLRLELKKPIGKLIQGDPDNLQSVGQMIKDIIKAIRPTLVCCIGDEVTKMCNKIGIKPNLAVFDFKVKRIKIYNSLEDLAFVKRTPGLIRVKNPAGHITKSLVKAIRKSLLDICQHGGQRLVKVIGEDDLAGVPAILLSPLNSVVLYGQPALTASDGCLAGQPDEGVVVVEVTEKMKERLLEIIKKYY